MADRRAAVEFVRRHSFALLVTSDNGEPVASHVPLLFDESASEYGMLRGHLARANPHADLLDGRRALAVFSGPHAYISPRWYQADNTVPTWNYAAVHAYGTCELITDERELIRLLADLTAVYEAGMPKPWTFDADSEFIRKLAKAVVGFRIPIDRLDAKAKLNQNHPAERRQRVIRELEQSSDADARAIAQLMISNSERGTRNAE
jgi:transcriptional regulator